MGSIKSGTTINPPVVNESVDNIREVCWPSSVFPVSEISQGGHWIIPCYISLRVVESTNCLVRLPYSSCREPVFLLESNSCNREWTLLGSSKNFLPFILLPDLGMVNFPVVLLPEKKLICTSFEGAL